MKLFHIIEVDGRIPGRGLAIEMDGRKVSGVHLVVGIVGPERRFVVNFGRGEVFSPSLRWARLSWVGGFRLRTARGVMPWPATGPVSQTEWNA